MSGVALRQFPGNDFLSDTEIRHWLHNECRLPPEYLRRLRQILLDKRTGNLRLNVREGVIFGFVVEERVSVGQHK